ncbi:mannose-6-phosphate isomerase [Fragilaria crotonensis]|nr:mannose-6-phosphate isomerase [Fragilaria crotonensis]
MEFMIALSKKITVGVVSGSDLPKQEEQLGECIASIFPYNFSQNGLVAYKNGELQEVQTIAEFLGEARQRQEDCQQSFEGHCGTRSSHQGKQTLVVGFHYLPQFDKADDTYFAIHLKGGTFVEFRSDMFIISPLGCNCCRDERNAYETFDLENDVRKNMVEAMKKEFSYELDLQHWRSDFV